MPTSKHATDQHGGRLAAEVLRAHGIETVFTLSGGHLFVLYDGCVQTDIALVDTRHEQTAAFAAEGFAKVTGRPGCAALTAGPGVTNGVSALASARLAGSPMLVIGGRAPQGRWGRGSLQELDHIPIVESVTKTAVTATPGAGIVTAVHEALLAARTPHRGPTFVDLPLDAFGPATVDIPAFEPRDTLGAEPDPDAVARIAAIVGTATRPVVVAGGDVYWAGGHEELRALRGGCERARACKWSWPRTPAGRSPARVLARPECRVARRRPGRRRGHAPRLPLGFR